MELMGHIENIHQNNRKLYGAPRVTEAMKNLGLPVSRSTVSRWQPSVKRRAVYIFYPPQWGQVCCPHTATALAALSKMSKTSLPPLSCNTMKEGRIRWEFSLD